MKTLVPILSLLALVRLAAPADEPLSLTAKGVLCRMGNVGEITLGIPALDGRGTHLGPIPASVKTDGKTLTAQFAAPFEGVTLQMKLLGDGRVEYDYGAMPKDLRIVMCQFNLPETAIVPGMTVTFDQNPPLTLPAQPGKTNKEVNLGQAHARKLVIQWPTGESLGLSTEATCWHGIQDARVWGKPFIGVCLTPSVIRNVPDGNESTFVMTFTTTSATAAHP